MTTTGPYEMSSPSPKFFRALVLTASFQMSHYSGPLCLSRTSLGRGGANPRQATQEVLCHSNVPL